MPLPIVETSTFIGTIPSTGEKFEFRPFRVKEQKVLLFAYETQDATQIFLALRNIVDACVVGNKEATDINKIPSFDAESIFLQISAKSVGEVSEIQVGCKKCNEFNDVKVYLNKAELKNFDPKHAVIKLSDDLGIKMRYSSIKEYLNILTNASSSNEKDIQTTTSKTIYELIEQSIDSIFTGDKVYSAKDYTLEEITEFIESLSIPQMKQIEDFFSFTPYLAAEVSFKCSKCGELNENREIKGIKNFF